MVTLRRLGRERGVSSVELAIYTPMLFFTVFLIVQAALVWHGNQIASAVAREAARDARAASTDRSNLADLESRWISYAEAVAGNGLQGVDVDIQVIGDDVRADVTGCPLQIVPLEIMCVDQSVQSPIEEFKPDL